jgi:hypothetical protein
MKMNSVVAGPVDVHDRLIRLQRVDTLEMAEQTEAIPPYQPLLPRFLGALVKCGARRPWPGPLRPGSSCTQVALGVDIPGFWPS